MRIYNGTKSMLDLPLTGMQRLSIPPRAVSGDFMPTNDFLSLLVTTFDYSELAIIVSGPYEISMCASVPGSVGFVVQTLEEAIERFAEKPVVPVVDPVKEPEVKVNEPESVIVEVDKEVEKPCCCGTTDECSCVSFNNENVEVTKEENVVEKEPVVADTMVVEAPAAPEVKKAVKKSAKKNSK